MSEKRLTLKDIHGSDPIAGVFFGRLNLSPFAALLFFIVLAIVYAIILPIVWGYPVEIHGINLINLFIVYPTAVYFYAYQPKSILRIYDSVTRFLRDEPGDDTPPLERAIFWHARPIWWIIGILLGLVGSSFGVIYSADHFQQFWYSANWFEILFVQFARFLSFYAIGVSASRHIATSIALNALFQKAQFPLTLDTDRLEIFTAVKRFALEFVGVAAIIGLTLGLQPLLSVPPMPEYAVYVTLYWVVAPVSFFLPLWQVHRRMAAIKNKMLNKLHRDFQEESYLLYNTVANDSKKDSANLYLKKSQTLTSIKQSIELVSKAHDWPFEGTTLYQLLITILSPFLLAIVDVIFDLINGYLF